MAKRLKRGRKTNSRNKGYFFRTGRGWYATEGNKKIPLTDAAGNHLKDPKAGPEIVKEAHARYLLTRSEQPRQAGCQPITVRLACQLYLDHCKGNSASSTFEGRSGILYDFCKGLPAALRNTPDAELSARVKEKARIHKGYGDLPVNELKPLHVDQWLAKHPKWDGGKRTKVQALKRAFNYCVTAGAIAANPLKGYKVARPNVRTTYLTPEQEQACYRFSKAAVATAIKVCIRTGARYGCEFAKLTAAHVTESEKGMEWRFSERESKTRKLRIIRIPANELAAKEVIEIVRQQIAKHPTGPIFRNTQGKPWTRASLGNRFTALRKRLARKGVELDADACMYSCRHTYAKRTLGGYWNGKPATIEQLAALMGNSREVCWEHYAHWCEAYTDPLWESA